MKYIHVILSFLFTLKLFAQNDTSFPLSVNIEIDKAYEVKLPKAYFANEVNRNIYNIATDSVQQKKCDLEVALKNNSQRPIFIWLMTCSWQDNFRINNNYTYLRENACYHNFPELVRIAQGESKIYKATICKSIKFENPCKNCIYGQQVETTKLGLIVVDDLFKPKLSHLFGYNLAMEDESCWKIIWSNPLYLLTEDEAHPKPVRIPVYGNGQR